MDRAVSIEELEPFGVQAREHVDTAAPIYQLLEHSFCESFLKNYMRSIDAPTLKTAASLFIKQYARIVVETTLYSMGSYNCAFSLPVRECHFNANRKLCIRKKSCSFQQWTFTEREIWRKQMLQEIFARHITPLIQAMKQTTSIRSDILWENVAVRVNSFYRKILKTEKDEIKRKQLISDFFFIKQAEGALFGLDDNPMESYLKIHPAYGETPVRKTCCFYHRLPKKAEQEIYCSNCPVKNKIEK